ncbi:MAG: hypothetical protein QOF83_2254 [Solirubrobacteraceae bacterium]|jgi:Tfp pilus assembly protein PilV|nr:hypothetical protein [Solirubrobacteraceae bacterium]
MRSFGPELVLEIVISAVGLILVLASRRLASVMNELSAEQTRYSSLLSQDAIDRLREMYRSPASDALVTWVVRVSGLLFIAGGVAAIIQHL